MDKIPSGLRMPCVATFMATATARLAPALSPTIITRSPVQPDCNSVQHNKYILDIHSSYCITMCQWPTMQTCTKTCQDNTSQTRMWANAKRDGHPSKYRWRPQFNAAKFGWRPLLECHAVMLPRCETRWNLLWCPKLANRSQPLVGQTSPYCKDMRRRYCCFISFFFIYRYVP